MRWRAWLLRGLAVAALAILAALWVLVRPLPEPMPPTPTPTSTLTPTLASPPTSTLTPTSTPTHTPIPTPTPTPTLACSETTGQVRELAYFSQTAGDEQPYRIYLPPCYGQTSRHYPVLYLLHGWPYDETHWDILGADEAADTGIGAGSLPPFIIVLPGGPERLYVNTSGGDHSFESQLVNDLIPHVDATHRTWANREGRAIGGISRGGVWALEIGFRHPNLFATVGAHSPALSVNLAPPVYDPFYLLREPGVATLRIYLDAGDSDWAREATQTLHQTLEAQDIAHEFVVHPGNHENGLWEANVAEYLTFYTAGWPGDDVPP